MIYILKRRSSSAANYDEYVTKIVRADTPSAARALANRQTGDEGPIWTNPSLVSCRRVREIGKPSVLLSDFVAG